MYCVIVRFPDDSGINRVLGPWLKQEDAQTVADTFRAFSQLFVFDVWPLEAIIWPATVVDTSGITEAMKTVLNDNS